MPRSASESSVAALSAFRLALANAGVRVSPAELSDAARALLALPSALDSRTTLHALLKAALIKRQSDGPAFDDVFNAFFRPAAPAAPNSHHHHHHHRDDEEARIVGVDLIYDHLPVRVEGEGKHEHGERIDLRRFFGEGDGEAGHDHHGGDRLRLTWLGREITFDEAGAPPAGLKNRDGAFGMRRVATTGLPGGLSDAGSIELPRDVVLERAGHHQSLASDPDEALLGNLETAIAETLEGGARAVIRATARERRIATRDLPDLRWDELSAADLKRLDAAAVRIGRRLGGAPGRLRHARHGRLDLRATFRAAVSTGGAPFRTVFRQRREDRPRLIVLTDVSLSVRAAAWFMAHVARAAQRQSGRVRAFVFVRDLAEVTRELGSNDVMTAIRAMFSGELLDVSASSDAGAAFRDWRIRYGSLLSRKTTVLILGDARNNGRDPGVDALAAIAERARRVIWLSPEPAGAWKLAGCDLPRYREHCALVASVRTPGDLERVALQLSGG